MIKHSFSVRIVEISIFIVSHGFAQMIRADKMLFLFVSLSIFLLTICAEWIPHSEIAEGEYVPNSYFQGQGIWITVTNLDNGCNRKLPRLYSVYSLGCLYTTSCYMVQYQPVDTDKLRSISLANNDNSLQKLNIGDNTDHIDDNMNGKKSNNKSSKQLQKKSNANNHELSIHNYQKYTNTDLEFIVAQINAGQDLFVTVGNYLNKNYGGQNDVKKVSYSYVLSFRYQALKMFLIPIILVAWVWFLFIHHLKKIIDYRLFNLSNIFYSYWYPGNNVWCGASASGGKKSLASVKSGLIGCQGQGLGLIQQNTSMSDNFFVFNCLSEKIQIMETVLLQCGDFVKSWKLPSNYRQRLWISINSHIVVLLVDLVLGILAGQALYKYSADIVTMLTDFSVFLQSDILKTAIESYRHSPMGIKLNPLITKKIGYVLKLLLREFSKAISLTSSLHDMMIKVIGCSGAAGLTVQLSLVIDLTRILTMHIMIIHKISSILFIFQCNLILTLFHLFKGQKVNILRKRVDTCECDRIQLLFGVVLFSMVFFLFPSFAAYFFLFSFTQGLVLLTQVALWSVVVFVRDFPYYSLVTSYYEPLCFTRGLRFRLMETDTATSIIDSSPVVETDYSTEGKGQSNFFHKGGEEEERKLSYVWDRFFNLFSFPFEVKVNAARMDEKSRMNKISFNNIAISDGTGNNEVELNTEGSLTSEEYSTGKIKSSPRLVMANKIAGQEMGIHPDENKERESLLKMEKRIDEKSVDRQQQQQQQQGLCEGKGLRESAGRGNLNLECLEVPSSSWLDTESSSPCSPSTAMSGRSPNSLSASVTPKRMSFNESSNPHTLDTNPTSRSLSLRVGHSHRRNQTSRFRSPGSSRTSRIYLLLAARPLLAISFFPKYFEYLSCFFSRTGLLMYFFEGVLWGSPSLDLDHVKRILQISQNSPKKDSIHFDGMTSSNISSRKSFYDVLRMVFECWQLQEPRDRRWFSISQTAAIFGDTDESNLLASERSQSSYEYESNDDPESNFENKSNQNVGENRRNRRNEILFTEPKIHKRLNKTLLMFVLVTYVICLISYIGGFTFFIFSLSARKPYYRNEQKMSVKK